MMESEYHDRFVAVVAVALFITLCKTREQYQQCCHQLCNSEYFLKALVPEGNGVTYLRGQKCEPRKTDFISRKTVKYKRYKLLSVYKNSENIVPMNSS